MKILLHSNAPWVPSAYGQQTGLWATHLARLGHEVVVSAFHGLQAAPMTWDGIQVIPGSAKGDPYGAALLADHVKYENADLVVTLMDIWVLSPDALAAIPVPVAHWMPVDCSPLGVMDALCLKESGARQIAMSQFGHKELTRAGFSPLYVPHGLHPAYTNTSASELPSLAEAKARFEIDGKFAVGINAANKDGFRKGMYEQFAAFSKFHAKHPDTVLLFHGAVAEEGALDLLSLARHCGIEDAVQWINQYGYTTGRIGVDHLIWWYRALDLYSACSLGEGFGIPILEAQAMEVPVVVTDASSMPELCAGGWLVGGEKFWNGMHRSCWLKPDVDQIARAYEKAYQRGAVYYAKKARTREFALQYEAQRVLTEYWKPALDALAAP